MVVIIPTKFCPAAVIIPVFPVAPTLDNSKLPEIWLLRLIALPISTSAWKVETPT